jgi:Alpha/beta hydrolase domain
MAGAAHATPDELSFSAAPADSSTTSRPSSTTSATSREGCARRSSTYPPATWRGSATGASFCFIAGYEIPFDQARIDALSRTHGAYVRAVTRDVEDLVADESDIPGGDTGVGPGTST